MRRKVRRTLTVSAAPSPSTAEESETLVFFNRTSFHFRLSVLSSLLLNQFNRPETNPIAITPRSKTVLEAVALPAVYGGFVRVIWLQKSKGAYSIMMAELSDDGTPIGEPLQIHSSFSPISGPAATYGTDGARIMIVWSEDFSDGTVRILSKVIDLI